MDVDLECDFMNPELLMAKRDFFDRFRMDGFEDDEDEMLEDFELELDMIMRALETGEISASDPGLKEVITALKATAALPGFPESIRKKLDRLEKFYKYGLSQAGWNKYSYINLEFDNQIICKKRNYKKEDNNETE